MKYAWMLVCSHQDFMTAFYEPQDRVQEKVCVYGIDRETNEQ